MVGPELPVHSRWERRCSKMKICIDLKENLFICLIFGLKMYEVFFLNPKQVNTEHSP